MKIYHGSLEIIREPRILIPTRTLDYGAGFYTTTSKEQAVSWVKRKLDGAAQQKGFLNIYDFDESNCKNLKALKFESPDENWVDFVMQNRTNKAFSHSYDIVIGPVANDRVYTAFALYEDGILDKQALIKELKAYKLVDQILFHTVKALKFLKFFGAEGVAK